MKKIVNYLKVYFVTINKSLLAAVTVFTALLIFANYYFGVNRYINRLPTPWDWAGWYAVFLVAFGGCYLLQQQLAGATVFRYRKFVALLLIAPAVFAWKMVAVVDYDFSTDFFKDEYWNAIVYWPYKVVMMTAMLYLVYRFFNNGEPFYGVTTKGFSITPYAIMLLLMVPLVAAAATQPDFLRMYPRLKDLAFLYQPGTGLYKLLYELSYGLDFFSIELFFRGFLVLAFARWAGKGAILPMAVFYCTIHFGKPMGECISSYFGGMILGVVSYHTRSIIGGFAVHVGIAWMMEVAGYFGRG